MHFYRQRKKRKYLSDVSGWEGVRLHIAGSDERWKVEIEMLIYPLQEVRP